MVDTVIDDDPQVPGQHIIRHVADDGVDIHRPWRAVVPADETPESFAARMLALYLDPPEPTEAEAHAALANAARQAISDHAEALIAEGVVVACQSFRTDDATVLRLREMADGLAASPNGTTARFRTRAGATMEIDANDAARLVAAVTAYRAAVLAASADAQAAVVADGEAVDPETLSVWPPVPDIAMGARP